MNVHAIEHLFIYCNSSMHIPIITKGRQIKQILQIIGQKHHHKQILKNDLSSNLSSKIKVRPPWNYISGIVIKNPFEMIVLASKKLEYLELVTYI